MSGEPGTKAVSRRLVFILKNGPVYSISDHIEYQVRALSREFDCEVWSQGPKDLTAEPCTRSLVRVVGSKNQYSLRALVRYIRALRSRLRECARNYPGRLVVLAHDPTKSGLIAWLAAAGLGVPLVVEVNGVYGSPDNYGSPTLTRRQAVRIRLLRLLAWLVLRRADMVRLLFPEQLSGFARLPERALTRTFFDLPTLERFHGSGESRTILFVGFPYFTKGVDILIRAFEQVAPDFRDWELLLVGHELEEPVRKQTTNPRVRVLRAMSNAQLAPYVNGAGIFVLPSRSEAMGRVLLEAAAAGKPRIGARVGGIPSVIRDGEDGLLFNKGDMQDLAAKLRQLMSSPELRKRLGDAARRRVEAEFSPGAYARHVKEMVDAACDRRSQRRRMRRRLAGLGREGGSI